MKIGNPEALEGTEGYMKVGAILDSEGVVWVVDRGAHLEASITMISAKLEVNREEALEAILSERVIDLGVQGFYLIAPDVFEAK